jgi:hypothetical protein
MTGIATFGGFWTFLNGVFALFFGANILYFLFGMTSRFLWILFDSSIHR